MNNILILSAVVIFACILLNRISEKFGVPMLLAFIVLGMIFGSDGLLKIPFDNFKVAYDLCSIALVFIMFYGGFGTNWNEAKPVYKRAIALSSIGVLITCIIVGFLTHYFLNLSMFNALLVGAVVSSTDAASVFSILRNRNLGLKENTASLLEIESGSNDPFAYMLTAIFLGLNQSSDEISYSHIGIEIALQIGVGLLVGIGLAYFAIWAFKNFNFSISGFNMAFMVGIAIFSYALSTKFDGNGYLAAYVVGIISGNKQIRDTKELSHFFDGITGLMQMFIFFILGLLVNPTDLIPVIPVAVVIFAILTLIARPICTYIIMRPFRSSLSQIALVSFCGLRGAASIVFAIFAIQEENIFKDVFNITFIIVLLSILLQGSLLPMVARGLKMVDMEENILKTFTDYSEEIPVNFIHFNIPANHKWIGRELKDITLPPDTLVAIVKRNGEYILPDGETRIHENDKFILCATVAKNMERLKIAEITVNADSEFIDKRISELCLEKGSQIVVVRRGKRAIIPRGDTMIKEGDFLLIHKMDNIAK